VNILKYLPPVKVKTPPVVVSPYIRSQSLARRAMRRKRHDEEPDNHDRWMVSYADFITLLFAFFVVMYAISSVSDSKYRIVSDSLITAFGKLPATPAIVTEGPIATTVIRPRMIQPKHINDGLRREREHMTHIARDILTVLAPLVDQGKVRVTQTDRGVNVEINASVLFASGDARLTEESSQALIAVAAVLKDDNHAIQVEGHTDSTPIKNAFFPSNWELSAVRASSVVRLFIENGVSQERLTAVGKGEIQPVADNATPEGRLRNRRVTVMILSGLPQTVTEVPLESTGRK